MANVAYSTNTYYRVPEFFIFTTMLVTTRTNSSCLRRIVCTRSIYFC